MASHVVKTEHSARPAYPVLKSIAQQLSMNVKCRRPAVWVYHEDLRDRLRLVGVRETPVSLLTRVLRPTQAACLEAGLPDLSALIVRKTKGDSGNLLQPAPSWWEPYEKAGLCVTGDVAFWFNKFREARDFEQWPESLFN